MGANAKPANARRLAIAISIVGALLSSSQRLPAQTPPSTASNKAIGTIKSITGTAIALTPDTGPEVTIAVQPATKFLRVAPGEKTLKNATPIQAQDLQVGDRILVAGQPSGDNTSLIASTVVVMTKTDLQAEHQREMDDWQKRGVDGLATAVDPTAGTVTISVRSKPTVVHTSSSTVVRRYPPDSVKFDEAKPSTLQEIHAGDQVRARGDRSADGAQLTADEVVSGSFRNIAGTVNSVDESSSTISVHDLLSKKNVTVKVTQDSQLRHLPPEMAQRLAMRLKRTGGVATTGAAPGGAGNAPSRPPMGAPGAMEGTEGAAGRRPGGAPDLQQMLSRMPAVALTDLHKGDAVVALSTEGTAGEGTAITLLTGVEAILQAAPNASGASILTPWSLSAPSGDAGGP
ncbi:MAG TPA: DUF5666 domain-containing protein [Candidatus Sulfotelmatobacter sp.]